jgi:hypothetical protein
METLFLSTRPEGHSHAAKEFRMLKILSALNLPTYILAIFLNIGKKWKTFCPNMEDCWESPFVSVASEKRKNM